MKSSWTQPPTASCSLQLERSSTTSSMSVEGPSFAQTPSGSTSGASGASRGRPARQGDFTLTSFNPFSEEDEHSSYALVSSLFSKVRNTFAVPLTSALAPAERKPQTATVQSQSAASTSRESLPKVPESRERRGSFGNLGGRYAAPPVVTPVISESPTFNTSIEIPSTRGGRFGFITPDAVEGTYGTAIPGFPIADDARSIKTSTSVGPKNASVSKVIRRLRGEGEHFVADLIGVNGAACHSNLNSI
jgi:1-phosphatidylinositol-3-phosphate 5-kinase